MIPTTAVDLDRWAVARDTDKFVQILRYLSGDKYLNMRLRAIEVLEDNYNENVIPLLLSEMGNSPDSRDKAAQALVHWGQKAAEYIGSYLQKSRMPNPVAQEAFRVIGEYDPETSYNIYLQLLLKHLGTDIVCANLNRIGMTGRFHALVNDADPFKRWVGLEVISNSRINRPVCEVLCATTQDADVQIRSACYDILEQFIDQEDPDQFEGFTIEEMKEMVTGPARRGLSDDDALVRMDAVRIIGEIRDEVSLERVIELSRDENRGVRKYSLFALGCFQHSGTKMMLIRSFLDPENDDRHRQYAVRALGTCRDEGCFEILRGIMAGETSIRMLARVTEALLEIDTRKAIDLLVTEIATKERLHRAIEHYVARIPKKMQGLTGMLKSDKHTKRINALIWLFGQLGGVESILSLCELVNDGDEYVDLIASAVGLILDDAEISEEEFLKEVTPFEGAGLHKVFQAIAKQKEAEEDDSRDLLMRDLGLI